MKNTLIVIIIAIFSCNQNPVNNQLQASECNLEGMHKLDLKDYNGAIEEFDKALEIDVNDASNYFGRGLAKDGLKDYDGAIDDYNKAIKLNSNDAIFYMMRGKAKICLGEKNSGCVDFSKAKELGYNQVDDIIKKNCR